MSSYWASVAVVFVPLGAVLKYLVWDYLHKVQSLHEKFRTSIDETHAAIHERRFLPVIADIYDSVTMRKAIVPAASTLEILTELSIDAKLREVTAAISDRVALDRSYQWAQRLSVWVAIPWLVGTVLFVVLFFAHYDANAGIKTLWVPTLVVPTIFSFCAGCITFGLHTWALNRFIRLLRENPL